MTSSSRSRSQRGTTLLLVSMMLPLVILPIVGLAIDGTILFIVQAKLSSAADGAALGAGRLLGTNANTAEIAGEFLRANFPHRYWGSSDVVPNISVVTNFSSHTITVNATVDTPLVFMRLFGHDHSTIAVSSVSTRSDTRVELVLDRSLSMYANIGALRTAATTFVNKFNPGVDQLGLIAYGGSAFVAYPTTRALSTTGPTTQFAATPGQGQDNMLTMINTLASGSDTGTAEGLWLAWKELQKAHSLDSDPTRLNAIVLFTDGVPNGFTAYFNDPNDPLGTSIKSTSACAHKTATNAAEEMRGWMGTYCSSGNCNGINWFNPTTSVGLGIFVPINLNPTQNAKWWTSHPDDGMDTSLTPVGVNISGTPVAGCAHLNDTDLADLAKIPSADVYGNLTTSSAYKQSLLYTTFGIDYLANQPTKGYQLALASWAAVDNMAQRILADTTMSIRIYCIGYTGNGGVDTVLLKRIANTLDSTNHNSNWKTGIYVPAADQTALNNAFNTVASEILRLAR